MQRRTLRQECVVVGRRVTVAIVAIGGYGSRYVRELLKPEHREGTQIVGAVDPEPERSRQLEELNSLGVPVFATLDELYDSVEDSPELVIISSPIHWHARQTILALSRGSNVLCEKPACATVQDVDAMAAARDASGKFVLIGYQRSFATAIQELKRDIQQGLLGKPKQLRSLCLMRRTHAYYGRNSWAGALKSSDGHWVLDSPANNASAHFLHSMFYVLGEEQDTSAQPVSVTAELYRANRITNADTVALRCRTACSAELLYFGTHAVDIKEGGLFHHTFENAIVTRDGDGNGLIMTADDGRTKSYPKVITAPDNEAKLAEALDCLRAGRKPACGIEAARSQTVCINGAQESMSEVVTFPESMIKITNLENDRVTHVPELIEALRTCCRESKLPSELGFEWAKPGREIDLTNYTRFPTYVDSFGG